MLQRSAGSSTATVTLHTRRHLESDYIAAENVTCEAVQAFGVDRGANDAVS